MVLLIATLIPIVNSDEVPSLVRRPLKSKTKGNLVKRSLTPSNINVVLCYKAFNDLEKLSRTGKISQDNYLMIKEEIFKDKSHDMTKMSEVHKLEKKMSPPTNSQSW